MVRGWLKRALPKLLDDQHPRPWQRLATLILLVPLVASTAVSLEPSQNAIDVQAARDRIAARAHANRLRAETARKSQHVAAPRRPTVATESTLDPTLLQKLCVDIGASSSIGLRQAMEDRSCAVTFSTPGDDPVAFVAVYDGHAGTHCASFLETALVRQVQQSLSATTLSFGALPHAMLGPLLTQACALADDSFLRSHVADDSGSCAAFALIGRETFAVGNIGDSQLVLGHNGDAIDLCAVHAPNDPTEKRRIEAANGRVLNNGRYIFGYLGVSRAFGDRMLKEDLARPIVISQPDVVVRARSPHDEFLLLACDGLFEVMTPASAASFVRAHLQHDRMGPAQVCDALIAHAIAAGSTDNVSAVLVVFAK
ncbi:hypothetical protein SPRG_03228 [Saprolegnia parasitica CBS 223.65]|uniref:PPM-type phosphatase domain-containing protein n=1 Tax=Saprolegnia parasitica (strain CBS 223.65) TaxID=695850 RepID=A0A067CRX8_SAPPC|nr:hypothetical protein SPRG_03228 [Saprolegnia parasitica CBS 223.65]KDO32010.1 hypothetical protein SPRG_03228 [Saprolegnia parasitica CBS 223.65]|eukprot:XP_012197203.1 hypothetical protein SPRG_03228 [Saprolegnia parasitica CBS 223.65]